MKFISLESVPIVAPLAAVNRRLVNWSTFPFCTCEHLPIVGSLEHAHVDQHPDCLHILFRQFVPVRRVLYLIETCRAFSVHGALVKVP